jgi:hypothetical protein
VDPAKRLELTTAFSVSSVKVRWVGCVAALVGACFSPSFDECKIVCGGGGCPEGLSCGASGFCELPGQAAVCGAAPDSSIPLEDGDLPPDPDGSQSSLDAPCEIELLQNGSFEDTQVNGAFRESAPWVPNGVPLPSYLMSGESGFQAHSGTWGVRFGGDDDLSQFLRQSLGTIPAGTTSLKLSFYYRATGDEPLLNRDLLEFELLEGMNELGTFTYIDGAIDRPAYTLEEGLRVGDFGGRQLTLSVHLTTDTADVTNFDLDDVSLRAVVCD